MASELVPHALTTVERVKDRMNLQSAESDKFFERTISAITDFVEGECNRRFLRTEYTNEVYSAYGNGQEMIALKNSPVESISSAQYRAGTVSAPSWTSFIADQFEIVGDGKSGLVRIYGGVPRGVNATRFSYTAGYKIDFSAPTDKTKHTLPADITDLVERLTVKAYKKRDMSAGKSSEGAGGSTTTWEPMLLPEDRLILDRYRRVPQFV